MCRENFKPNVYVNPEFNHEYLVTVTVYLDFSNDAETTCTISECQKNLYIHVKSRNTERA